MALNVKNVPPSNLGGGKFQGFSPDQFANNARGGNDAISRKVIRNAWNNPYAVGTVNNVPRAIGPFRAVTNRGDFLSRVNYSCGGPNPVTLDRYKRKNNVGSVPSHCDGTNIPASTCNPKFVPDSSDYIRYKRIRSANLTYNDVKFGGDDHNASYVPLMYVRRR